MQRTLRDLAQFEMPKKFLLVTEDFSIEAGELTPTLKVRRRIVEERHTDRIEALYVEGPEPHRPDHALRSARRVPTHQPPALAISVDQLGDRDPRPSPTTRSPGSSTRAASRTHAGSLAERRHPAPRHASSAS